MHEVLYIYMLDCHSCCKWCSSLWATVVKRYYLLYMNAKYAGMHKRSVCVCVCAPHSVTQCHTCTHAHNHGVDDSRFMCALTSFVL